jgi:predicted  nucleic acid-binding Zn-ribbon protein
MLKLGKSFSLLVCLCPLVFAPSSAQAQAAAPTSNQAPAQTPAQEDAASSALSSTEARVEISAYKGPELRSYAQMLKGLLVYQEKRQHAPDSELYFILIPRKKEIRLEGLTMRLASDETSTTIPVDTGGKFQLPLIELKSDNEYDLILNRPKGQFYIKPYVKSANLNHDTKRMGDLRLECQVRWAIEKQDVSLVFSAYVKLMSSGNPCEAKTVAVYYFAPVGVEVVTFDAPQKKYVIPVNSDGKYTLPLEDKSISDDVLVSFVRKAASHQE